MKLYFANLLNFGDQINPWFWPKFLGDDYLRTKTGHDYFIGIGTLLNDQVPATGRPNLVFGSGFGYGARPRDHEQWDFICVRGFRTAHEFGLDPSIAASDPAVMVPRYFKPSEKGSDRMTSFLPHWTTAQDHDWLKTCQRIGIQYIDPRTDDVEDVFSRIANSSMVICESMHGAIIADSYRVPWIAARSRRSIDANKWNDWAETVGVHVNWHFFPPIWREGWRKHACRMYKPITGQWLRYLSNHAKPQLSSDSALLSAQTKLLEARERFEKCIRS